MVHILIQHMDSGERSRVLEPSCLTNTKSSTRRKDCLRLYYGVGVQCVNEKVIES